MLFAFDVYTQWPQTPDPADCFGCCVFTLALFIAPLVMLTLMKRQKGE
jgi:hypothetical protein